MGDSNPPTAVSDHYEKAEPLIAELYFIISVTTMAIRMMIKSSSLVRVQKCFMVVLSLKCANWRGSVLGRLLCFGCKYILNRATEQLGDFEGQGQAGVILLGFNGVDGLARNGELICHITLRPALLGAEIP